MIVEGRRDHSVDVLRVVAMVGVVLGHWLVTGLVEGPGGLVTASPLEGRPGLAPATWFFHTHRGAKALLAVAIVASSDLLGGSPLAVLAAWAIPWLLGSSVADGHLARRRHGIALAVGGAAALAALITLGDYPVSAVGVPGEGRSNLDPPSFAAVALAVTQIGCFLTLRSSRPAPPPGDSRRNDRAALTTALNRRMLPIFLWHQSVLIGFAVLVGGPGLIGPPDPIARLAWVPALCLALATTRPHHRARPRHRKAAPPQGPRHRARPRHHKASLP